MKLTIANRYSSLTVPPTRVYPRIISSVGPIVIDGVASFVYRLIYVPVTFLVLLELWQVFDDFPTKAEWFETVASGVGSTGSFEPESTL